MNLLCRPTESLGKAQQMVDLLPNFKIKLKFQTKSASMQNLAECAFGKSKTFSELE